MAIIERPAPGIIVPALPAGAPAITPTRTFGALKRPVASTGWKSWLFTVDHKKLGLMYGATAMFFFIVGGLEAVLIRLQLAAPEGKVLNADLYNQMFTMHATTMVFLFVMPMAAGFANYFVPLQIGARDVAFPRINAFGFWCLLAGGIVVNLAWFLGGAADGGWFMYAPNSGPVFSPSRWCRLLGSRSANRWYRVAHWCDQLDRDRAEHAGTGHDIDEDAGIHLADHSGAVPVAVRDSRHHGGFVLAHVPAQFWRPHSLTLRQVPTHCCGSTCSGSSVIPRSTC